MHVACVLVEVRRSTYYIISVWQFCFQQLPGNVLVHLNIYDVEAYEFILGSFLWQM